MNFQEINEQLRAHIGSIVADICPGGATSGQEYVAASISGGKGRSFSINLNTGKWADFATSDRGGDIISLYARARGLNNGEAAKELQTNYLGKMPVKHNYPVKQETPKNIIKPPANHTPPEITFQGQSHSQRYVYRDQNGDALFYVFRFDLADGKKHFFPCTFTDAGVWQKKAWPSPRPLYNLDKIYQDPEKSILLVEGEKAADAAELMLPMYTITTWSSGATAFDKTDFSPLYGRKVLLWPDGDDVGIKAMSTIASALAERCPVVKIINPDRNSGWDAADAYADGMRVEEFKLWVKNIVTELPRPAREPELDHATHAQSLSLRYIEIGLDLVGKQKEPACNVNNVVKIINNDEFLRGHIWLDEFHQSIMTDYDKPGRARKWNNYDDVNILCYLQESWKITNLKSYTTKEGIQVAASRDRRNELKDWILSLKWDGTDRISSFLTNTYGCIDTEYTRAVSKNWMIALAARAITPGCKFDEMLILEGDQGIKKSTSLRALAGKYFAECNSSLEHKDFMQELAGTWVVEFGELDNFRKAESTLIKKKLSQQSDRYRPSHMPYVVDVPRTCVFVGTTNQTSYLKDETGGRRFWPISCTRADLDYILANREQLFAEAAARFIRGETWYEMPATATNEAAERYESDPWEEIIASCVDFERNIIRYYSGSTELQFDITIRNVAEHLLQIKADRFSQNDSRRISKCLRRLGFKSNKTRRNNVGIVVYRQQPQNSVAKEDGC